MILKKLKGLGMPARPLAHYCAVQPLEQGEGLVKEGSIYKPFGSAAAKFVYGKVLACGRDVRDIRPGDVVVYEVGSGHPSLSWVIDAETFGGDEGKFASIIPCYNRPLRARTEDFEELRLREVRVRELQELEEVRGLSEKDHDELMRHSIACKEIMDRQGESATNHNYFKVRFKDPGKTRGIIGVVEREEGHSILD